MTIIFLGGVPGTGKTTLAYYLAKEYQIDKIISLDVIKSVLKHFILKSDEPYLYATTHSAYKLENLNIIDGFKKHANIINNYFLDLISEFKNEKAIIVEGATITKEFVDNFKNYDTYYFNLYVDSKEELINRYKSKMKMRQGEWIKNIDNILLINEFLINQAQKNINTKSMNETIDIVRKCIDESIFL